MLLVIAQISSAEIFKWTDDEGRVHFGDSPKAEHNAERVVLKINSYQHVSFDDLTFYQPPQNDKITIFTTDWCTYCNKAKDYFKQSGIAYTEYDIEKNKHGKQLYDQIGGTGVPVILAGKKRMNGFSIAGFERLLK